MILTNEEIISALDDAVCCLEDADIAYARAIEAAILNKLEPICEIIRGKDDIGTMRTAVWKNGIFADVGIKLYRLPNPAPSETPSK